MSGDGDHRGIETERLDCGYGETVILHDVAIRLPAGQISCILGPSGCGKSTLLRTLLLLERPIGGDIRFDGHSIVGFDRTELERFRRQVGVLFQGAALFNSLTLLENAAFPVLERTRIARAEAHDLALRKLDLVGLAPFAHYLPSRVSGGMRKRCGIARALALDPEYLFLDEPSAGLDPVTAAEIDRLILGIRDRLGSTIVIVTHELASIDAIGDHLVMLAGGRVVAEGPPDTVRAMDDPVVHAFFNRIPPEADRAAGRSRFEGRILASPGANSAPTAEPTAPPGPAGRTGGGSRV